VGWEGGESVGEKRGGQIGGENKRGGGKIRGVEGENKRGGAG
jgi:hypothetical protein